jgi:hypothetical protein
MQPTASLTETLQKLLDYDETGDIRRMYEIAAIRGW